MQTLDQEVLQRVARWLAEGERPWLCTIVRSSGSSPRPVGSMLSVLDSGRQIGTVSGGCIEEDLLERLRAGAYTGSQPELLEYGVSAQENERLGLPCGGKLILLLQRLDDADAAWLADVIDALEHRQCIERHVSLLDGLTRSKVVEHFSPLAIDDNQLRQCFGPRMRLLLVGAGQLAQSLAELALAMDYEVIVTDPRHTFLEQWSGPQVNLIQGMPDDVVLEHVNDKHSIVITLTHDPRIDDMALMEALGTRAWYVGSLGSLRTTEQRLLRLRQLDIPEEQIARLHAPVGLDIGSKTPIEIAVAIMAELTQLQRKEIDQKDADNSSLGC